MRTATITTMAGLLGAVLVLGACSGGGVREQLGLGKQSPDEFRVVSRAPLTVPPSFALRPPEPGAVRPQEGTTSQQARRAVFRLSDEQGERRLDEAMPDDGRSVGERSLMLAAGVDQRDPNIRLTVDRETRAINREGQDLADRLIFWKEPESRAVAIDAGEESRRLREAQALGQEITGEGAPTIERRRRSLFERLF